MNTQQIRALALEHGLSKEEYQQVLDTLERAPSQAEVGVLSAMWSEHCAYKSSRVHLKRLHTTGEQVIQGPGENAGVVDIGGGLVAVFKMESHNHPSFIEPFEGAATGVGGILRDVFTMGARPIALLNSLRFGKISHDKTPHLFHGVVGGISSYGNCVGVPTVGGEVYFDACYEGNILVNVFALGVAKADAIFTASAKGPGNVVLYVGARTGRDGIHGATMASAQFDEQTQDKRPTVQVGDPFGEKCLIEACLDLMQTSYVVGIQDMGAAGLTSASVEMSARGGCGMRLDVDAIPKRAPAMSAYECLLSESQERMLVVVQPKDVQAVQAIFERWDVLCVPVGEVIAQRALQVVEDDHVVCDLPIGMLTDEAPGYDRPQKRPRYMYRLANVTFAQPESISQAWVSLIGSPNLCSKRFIYEQFDAHVGLGTLVGPGKADAAVLRVPGTDRRLSLSVDCNSRFCYLNPEQGAALALAECARNVSCTGATPIAATDCLNFGDPTNPEIMWQLARAVDGLASACKALNVPIVSGNVSLYNATDGVGIYPTPTVGVVGVFDDEQPVCTPGFKQAGDVVYVLGHTNESDLGGSAYAHVVHNQLGARVPSLDLALEGRVQTAVRALIGKRLTQSAHDCADGGLGVALLMCCLLAEGTLGFINAKLPPYQRLDHWLFCESPSRCIVSVSPSQTQDVETLLTAYDVPFTHLGQVTHVPCVMLAEPGVVVDIKEARHAYSHGLAPLL